MVLKVGDLVEYVGADTHRQLCFRGHTVKITGVHGSQVTVNGWDLPRFKQEDFKLIVHIVPVKRFSLKWFVGHGCRLYHYLRGDYKQSK